MAKGWGDSGVAERRSGPRSTYTTGDGPDNIAALAVARQRVARIILSPAPKPASRPELVKLHLPRRGAGGGDRYGPATSPQAMPNVKCVTFNTAMSAISCRNSIQKGMGGLVMSRVQIAPILVVIAGAGAFGLFSLAMLRL